MIDWKKYIQIDRSWVSRQLELHFNQIDSKINVKLYTVKVSGTTMLPNGLVEELHLMLPDYIQSKQEIERVGERKAALKANHFFGRKDPRADGKYGELLLFALVESILGCKMVAHKIRTLTNFKDQIKGGDGIFLGNYIIPDGREEAAYLIGESKVTAQYSVAIDESLGSINRFNDVKNSPEFLSNELVIAKDNLLVEDTLDIDEIYDCLTPTTDKFRNQILVHPILLMYNDATIKKVESQSATRADLEDNIKKSIEDKQLDLVTLINQKLQDYPLVKNVYLDFFLIPYNDIDAFRNAMYYQIHGVTYS